MLVKISECRRVPRLGAGAKASQTEILDNKGVKPMQQAAPIKWGSAVRVSKEAMIGRCSSWPGQEQGLKRYGKQNRGFQLEDFKRRDRFQLFE
ncbi:hypothetical protein OB13_06140 [Pontibacter sp. HJ8]